MTPLKGGQKSSFSLPDAVSPDFRILRTNFAKSASYTRAAAVCFTAKSLFHRGDAETRREEASIRVAAANATEGDNRHAESAEKKNFSSSALSAWPLFQRLFLEP